MYGVLFGDKHSYRDWKLITKSRPDVGSPAPKTTYIDIPEADGQLDLTESLSGEVKFENREMKFEFAVIEARQRWTTLYSEIMNYLHGQNLQVVLDEDPNHFYSGRFTVDEWESDKKTSTLVIVGVVDPYKYDLNTSLEDWIWDTFNFETDCIREYADLEVDGELEFTVQGSRKSAVPSFIVELDEGETVMQVVYQNVTYNLQEGTNRVVNIIVKDGESTLTFIGHGKVSIEYRGGSL